MLRVTLLERRRAGDVRLRPRRSRSAPTPRASRRQRPSEGLGERRPAGALARYGSCTRSSNAAPNQSLHPDAAPAPSSAARASVNAASPCGTDSGSAARAASVRTRSAGTSATGVSGSMSAMRAIRPSQVSVTPPDECGRQVVGVRLERHAEREQLLHRHTARRRAQPERDRGRARAEAALEWDLVHEVEPLPGRVCEQRVSPD